MFQSLEGDTFFYGNEVGNTLKRDFHCYNEIGCGSITQSSSAKRLKKAKDGQSSAQPTPENSRSPSPLIDSTLEAIAMSTRTDSGAARESSPYVEVEDYIREGYGSPFINGAYNTRLSLENITPVNYSLYDVEAEEFEESEFAGTHLRRSQEESRETSQDVEME
ncbi:LAFA_0E03532g1_1 [Lachancea sp. 'fantastica']|nr:LAFA_0E03532g1_1 [Lachancea sp. 'fantastica']